jgi:predicted PurR-regulated permease PerM
VERSSPAIEDVATPVAASESTAGEQRRVTFDITGSAVAKLVVGLLLLAFVADLAGQIREVFVWTLAAGFLAIALNPLVERIEPVLGRRIASTIVVTASAICFLAIVAALVMPFVTQVDRLSTALPQAIADAREDSTIKSLDNRYDIAEHVRQHLDVLPDVVFGAAGTVLGGAVAVSTIFFLTLFLLYELPGIVRLALGQIPPGRRPRFVAAARHMNRNVGGYVAGNLAISVICGAVTTLSLYLLGVPYALALGVFMAVFDLIPLVGATIGSVVVIASAFIFVDTRAGIIMFVIVMVYQQVENHILQPLVYGRTVQIPSLIVLIAVLCGGAVLGLVGALLAIPIAGTIHAVASELLAERADRLNAGVGG